MLCIWKKYIFILLQTLSKYLHCLFRCNSFIWIVDECSILPHRAIYLSIIIKNEKKYTNQTIRKEESWLLSMVNTECLQQPMPSAGTAGAQHCWRENSSYLLRSWVSAGLYQLTTCSLQACQVFLDKCRTHMFFLFVDSLFSEVGVFSSFFPCQWFWVGKTDRIWTACAKGGRKC